MQPETNETPEAITVEMDSACRLRARSRSELSEGDNTRNNGVACANSIAFCKTVSNLYMLHTLKHANKPCLTRGEALKRIALSVLCLLVTATQFVSLYFLTYGFQLWAQPLYVDPALSHGTHIAFDMFGQLYPNSSPQEYTGLHAHRSYQQYTYRNSLTPPFKENITDYFGYDDDATVVPTFVLFVWFFTMFTLILCGLLSKPMRSAVSSLWICFCYDDDDRYPRSAYYYIMSIFVKALHLALVFCTVIFIVNTLCFALYFGVAIAVDWRILLFPLAAICIVRADEWVFKCSDVMQSNDFWCVRVTKHYGKTERKLFCWFVFVCISWTVAWYLASNPIYHWNDGIDTYGVRSYNFAILIVLCFVMLLMWLPMQPSLFKCVVHHFIGDISGVMVSLAAALVMYYVPVFEMYTYEVEWSSVIDREDIDTYYAPISAPKSVTNIQIVSVVAMILCGFNLVLFAYELYGTHSVSKYRIVLSVMSPLMCLIALIYCFAEYGLTIINIGTQNVVLFATPVIIACYVVNWKQMWSHLKPYSKPDGYNYLIWWLIASAIIISFGLCYNSTTN